MGKLVAVEGDYDTQDDCHLVPAGSGSYDITVDQQDFVFIEDKLRVVEGEDFNTHAGGDCEGLAAKSSGGSSFVFIECKDGNLKPVAREGDVSESESCHTFSGITVDQQDFVFEEESASHD